MYEELIQRLREASKMSEALAVLLPNSDGSATAKLYNDAADTIKVLCAHLPKWIPVAETLPEEEKRTYWICTDTGYQCECRWTNNRFGIGESDEWGWNIADVPQYHKVTAWMRLPGPYEPPKEE